MAKRPTYEELEQRVKELERQSLECKRAEEALREGENKYRELADLLPQTVYELDERGNFTFANRYGFQSSGYTQEDIDKGLNALQLFIPEDRERVAQNMRKILSGERSEGHEYTALRKDGSTFPVLIYSSPIVRDNKPVGLRGLVIDMTEYKLAEEKLRESEERYRDLVENINDVIYAVDEHGVIAYVSPVVESSIGYSPSELVGRSFAEHIYQEDLPRSMEGFHSVLSGQITTDEYRILIKSGEIRWMRTSNRPLFKGNRVIGAHGVLMDIHERKQAEDTLRESEEKFRTLAEQSPNMIFINEKGRVVYANKKCEEVMGYTREDFYSQDFDFLCLIAPEHRNLIISMFHKHMEGEETAPYDYALVTKDGKRIEAIITSKLIDYNGDGFLDIFLGLKALLADASYIYVFTGPNFQQEPSTIIEQPLDLNISDPRNFMIGLWNIFCMIS